MAPDENDVEGGLVEEFPFLFKKSTNCWNFLEDCLGGDNTSFDSEHAADWCISLEKADWCTSLQAADWCLSLQAPESLSSSEISVGGAMLRSAFELIWTALLRLYFADGGKVITGLFSAHIKPAELGVVFPIDLNWLFAVEGKKILSSGISEVISLSIIQSWVYCLVKSILDTLLNIGGISQSVKITGIKILCLCSIK